jgi:hypothetical protein
VDKQGQGLLLCERLRWLDLAAVCLYLETQLFCLPTGEVEILDPFLHYQTHHPGVEFSMDSCRTRERGS